MLCNPVQVQQLTPRSKVPAKFSLSVFTEFTEISDNKTRMHSSRICTARRNCRFSCNTCPPLPYTPPSMHPLPCMPPCLAHPLPCMPPCLAHPLPCMPHASHTNCHTHPTTHAPPSPHTPGMPPLPHTSPCGQNSWHTLVKTLPCPKLRFRAVNICYYGKRARTCHTSDWSHNGCPRNKSSSVRTFCPNDY